MPAHRMFSACRVDDGALDDDDGRRANDAARTSMCINSRVVVLWVDVAVPVVSVGVDDSGAALHRRLSSQRW